MTDSTDNSEPPPEEAEASGEEAPSEPPAAGAEGAESEEATIERLRDQLLRTAADFDNFRKRARRDVEEATRRAREDTVRELLPIIDDLERAVAAADSATDVEGIAQGVRMVLKSFEEIGARMKLERVQALGTRFDPNVHDAIQQLPTEDHEPGAIVAEITPGYRLGERLLRPAMVVVAKKPEGA